MLVRIAQTGSIAGHFLGVGTRAYSVKNARFQQAVPIWRAAKCDLLGHRRDAETELVSCEARVTVTVETVSKDNQPRSPIPVPHANQRRNAARRPLFFFSFCPTPTDEADEADEGGRSFVGAGQAPVIFDIGQYFLGGYHWPQLFWIFFLSFSFFFFLLTALSK